MVVYSYREWSGDGDVDRTADSVQKVFGVPSLAQINTEIVSTHILCLIRSCGLWNSLLFSMLSLHWTILSFRVRGV